MKTERKTTKFDMAIARQKIEQGKRGKWWRKTGGKTSGFKYSDKNEKIISDERDLERIKSLAIPPAWKYVRISPLASSSLQAIGMDTTGRIQYLYNPKFAEKQQQKKFSKIEKFGDYLPKLRKLTNENIALEGFPREKVLAVMMRLINSLYIRVGTEKSVKQYKTYGITTLQNRHLEIGRKGQLVFSFVGKHHIKHRKVLVDEELAAIMRDLKSLGGARKLFHYLDENGKPHDIKPRDLNEYLKTATAPEFSAKDFRTWGGTLLAAVELAEIGAAKEEKQLQKNICKAVKRVAEKLGNTPTVCRASYIHPAVLKSYESRITLDEFSPRKFRRAKRIENDYELEEKALMKLFQNDCDSKQS
ncbi:MAG: DNA topoisomerase IB [Pyrinomonadaceae bacterium]